MPFRAHPVPDSTYQSDTALRIRPKRFRSMPSMNRVDAEQSSNSGHRPRPVPLSTYIRPSPSLDDLRVLRRERRAMEGLAEAREPRGLEVSGKISIENFLKSRNEIYLHRIGIECFY